MIRVEGNTIYMNETPVAVIMDSTSAQVRADFQFQLRQLRVLEKIDAAKINVRDMAGLVQKLAESLQLSAEAAVDPDAEEMLK